MTYRYIQDPAHGWVEVPLQELLELKIADKISPFSYVNENFAYLEEDCDAALFFTARERKGLRTLFTTEVHTHLTPIRSYASYDRNLYRCVTTPTP